MFLLLTDRSQAELAERPESNDIEWECTLQPEVRRMSFLRVWLSLSVGPSSSIFPYSRWFPPSSEIDSTIVLHQTERCRSLCPGVHFRSFRFHAPTPNVTLTPDLQPPFGPSAPVGLVLFLEILRYRVWLEIPLDVLFQPIFEPNPQRVLLDKWSVCRVMNQHIEWVSTNIYCVQ